MDLLATKKMWSKIIEHNTAKYSFMLNIHFPIFIFIMKLHRTQFLKVLNQVLLCSRLNLRNAVFPLELVCNKLYFETKSALARRG